jgi:hypothetical protein
MQTLNSTEGGPSKLSAVSFASLLRNKHDIFFAERVVRGNHHVLAIFPRTDRTLLLQRIAEAEQHGFRALGIRSPSR